MRPAPAACLAVCGGGVASVLRKWELRNAGLPQSCPDFFCRVIGLICRLARQCLAQGVEYPGVRVASAAAVGASVLRTHLLAPSLVTVRASD